MEQFITKYAELIIGVLSGFDRLVFRGSLKTLSYLSGMQKYLNFADVLLKDFGNHVESMSKRIKKTTKALAKARGITEVYLPSPKTDKEAVARQIALDQGITEGPICVLSTVEVCRSYNVRHDSKTKMIHLEPAWRKCLFYYHYMIHPVFGFMNARIQTWAPFPIQICINGREWLSRQLDAAQIDYIRRDNCIVWVEDVPRAQQLLDEQLKVSWPKLLNEIAFELNPIHEELFKGFPVRYYWYTHQSEWATDIMFDKPQDLARLYPRIVHHAIMNFSSPDVMRFLGHHVTNQGNVNGHFKGEIISSYRCRFEGVRVKHSVNDNSIKLYDKQGSVLRAETTINNNRGLKVRRHREGEHNEPKSWENLRKGVADLSRRAYLSQAANERYIEALAAVSDDATLAELTKDLYRPVTYQGKRFRAIHTWDPNEMDFLKIIAGGEFLITGFRNRDIVKLLFPAASMSAKDRKRTSARISHRLRILRAHGLIAKIQHTHRYRVTKKGRRIITALLSAQQATITQLTDKAA